MVYKRGSHCPASQVSASWLMAIVRAKVLTDNQTRKIENILPNREAERTRDRHTIRPEERACRCNTLRGILKRMLRKVLPIRHRRRIIEQLLARYQLPYVNTQTKHRVLPPRHTWPHPQGPPSPTLSTSQTPPPQVRPPPSSSTQRSASPHN
jgi:hypothetical protein